MANIYVKSGASGAANGTSWTDAYTTIAAAIATWTSSDIIYVSHQHNETSASTITIRKASAGAPVPIICVNDGATPPTTLATTGLVAGQVGVIVDGDLFVYGMTFRNSTGGTSTALEISEVAGGKGIYESCHFELAGGASSILKIGTLAGTAIRTAPVFKNCTLKFSNAGQGLVMGHGRSTFIGGGIDSGGTQNTSLFFSDSTYAQGAGGFHKFIGFDFSFLGAGKTLFPQSKATQLFHLIDCKLGAATVYANPDDAAGTRVVLINTGASNNNYSYGVKDYAGTVDIDTSQYITSGSTAATDGTQAFSWKITGNANAKFFQPFHTEWIGIWNDATGSALTATLEVLVDAAAGYNDDEIWLEGVYQANTGDQLAAEFSDRRALMASSTVQATGTGTSAWTKGTAATGWISQKLHASFTPQKPGMIYLRVCMAKNAVAYVNPHPSIA